MSLDVFTPAERLRALRWPELHPLGELSLSPDDWLIVCAGFEDRSLAALKGGIVSRAPFRALLILYRPFLPENREEEMREICYKGGIDFRELAYDRENLVGFGGRLVEEISPCQGRVFVDISGMSRLMITQIVVALAARPERFMNCFVLYSEAKVYPPSQAEAEAELAKSESDPTSSILFLSSGVYEVTVVPELAALASPAAQTRLVTFPSLDAHHLIALRVELQPSRFSFIEGVPPSPQNKWRQQFIAEMNRLSDIRDAERYSTSTLVYQETLGCLLDLYSRHAIRERLLVAPTGSKMQTVAVGIFRSFVHDVQIVHPTPRGFRSPEDYTRGTGPLHLLPLSTFTRDMLKEEG